MIAAAPDQAQFTEFFQDWSNVTVRVRIICFGLGHDTTVWQHSKVSAWGRAELTEKHVHTKKTSTRKFMQSGQILVGALYVDNDSGLILVWKIHESAFEMHPFWLYAHVFP